MLCVKYQLTYSLTCYVSLYFTHLATEVVGSLKHVDPGNQNGLPLMASMCAVKRAREREREIDNDGA